MSATLFNLLCTVGQLVGAATPIIAGLALLAFFWGLAMYLFSLSGGEGTAAHSMYGAPATPQNKQRGKTIMIYGIIVLFVMVSIWGIVSILQNTFGVGSGGSIRPPTISGAPPATINQYNCPSN